MRSLILSDIHANLEALEACLAVARGKYDRTLCLGDLVGYGPDPNAVIRPVRELAEVIIRGNHDKACCGITDAADFNPLARAATMWTRSELTPEHREFLRELPQGPVRVDGFDLVHGAPADEDEYLVGIETAAPVLRDLAAPTVFFGHTHLQGGFMLSPNRGFRPIYCESPPSSKGDAFNWSLKLEEGGRYLVNPGSVGQPRDGDWRAAFAILDETARAVEYYRVPYNLAATQEKMKHAALPEPLIRRLELGR